MSATLFVIIWTLSWIGASIVFKKQGKTKQPIGAGFLASLLIINFAYWPYTLLNPSTEELLAKAQRAEQQYFLYSKGSLDHSKICNAATDTLKYYQKVGDAEKIKLFEYIIVDDKCL